MSTDRVQIYDTTLRDGSQMEGISFSVEDKISICGKTILETEGFDLQREGVAPLSDTFTDQVPEAVHFVITAVDNQISPLANIGQKVFLVSDGIFQ